MTPPSALFVVIVFAAVYAGMALGRWPGLRVDRTGIALLGAIVLYIGGAVSGEGVLLAIDFPTLIVLFGLMILSGQFAVCGFYDWCSARIAGSRAPPAVILALTVAVAGGLSAVLANGVIVFAMTPLLCAGLKSRGLDPRPHLIALAGGANAGSAATLIGNPQNILIGQVGRLGSGGGADLRAARTLGRPDDARILRRRRRLAALARPGRWLVRLPPDPTERHRSGCAARRSARPSASRI